MPTKSNITQPRVFSCFLHKILLNSLCISGRGKALLGCEMVMAHLLVQNGIKVVDRKNSPESVTFC